jgi:hypothetical protein
LGPTSADVEVSSSFGPHTKMLAAASGALAIVMIVAIVVSATPSPSDGPTALSATTAPIVAFSPAGLDDLGDVATIDEPLVHRSTTRNTVSVAQTLLLVSMTAIPNEIASAPAFIAKAPIVAEQLPGSRDAVVIQTDDVTYHCTWGVVELLEMPDGTMILDDQGELVAHVDEGEFIARADD